MPWVQERDLSAGQRYTIDAVSATTSAFSVIGGTSIILSYVLLRSFRSTSRRFLAFLSLADVLGALFSLLLIVPSRHNKSACYLYTHTSTWCNLSSFLWTMCTSYVVYRNIKSPGSSWPSERDRHVHVLAHCLCWGLPTLMIAVLAFFKDASSQQDIGCWIPRSPMRFMMLRLFLTYIPLWVAWIFNSVMYYLSVRTARRMLEPVLAKEAKESSALLSIGAEESTTQVLKRQLRRMALIPVLFVVLRFWGSINVVKDMVSSDTHVFPIDILEAFGDQAQALVHSLLFVFGHSGVRREFVQWWRSRRTDPTSRQDPTRPFADGV